MKTLMGMHVGSAFEVAQIPFGSCVEIELVGKSDDPGRSAPGTHRAESERVLESRNP